MKNIDNFICEKLRMSSKSNTTPTTVDEKFLRDLLNKKWKFDLELFDYLEDELGFEFDEWDGMDMDEEFKCWSDKYNIGIYGQMLSNHKVFDDTFLEIFTNKKDYEKYR